MELETLKSLTKLKRVEVQMVNGVLFTGKLRVERTEQLSTLDWPVEAVIINDSVSDTPAPAHDIFLSPEHVISVRPKP